MVGHEDDMMDENLIFFSTFGDNTKGYPCDLPLVEPEGPVIGPAVRQAHGPERSRRTEQVIWIHCLNDT